MPRTHDISRSARRRELHEQAIGAGVANPASLALALAAAEAEGWRATAIRAAGDQVTVTVEKARRVLPRGGIAARIRAERAQGLSLRVIGRGLERDGVQAPRGTSWAPSTVARVGCG